MHIHLFLKNSFCLNGISCLNMFNEHIRTVSQQPPATCHPRQPARVLLLVWFVCLSVCLLACLSVGISLNGLYVYLSFGRCVICAHACMCVYTTCICMHACMLVCMCMYVWLHAAVFVCMYDCVLAMFVCVCMIACCYVCMYVWLHVAMFVFVYVCMCV